MTELNVFLKNDRNHKMDMEMIIIKKLGINRLIFNHNKQLHEQVLFMASGTPKPDGSKISNPWIINGSR